MNITIPIVAAASAAPILAPAGYAEPCMRPSGNDCGSRCGQRLYGE